MITVQVRGADDVHRMLADYMTPKLPRRMQTATKAGAMVFKEPLRIEARKVSKRLARAVSVRMARRDRPATIVLFRTPLAWFRHFVIGGTRAHGPRRAPLLVWLAGGGVIRAHRVRGVPPNPIVARTVARYERRAYDAIDKSLDASETT